MPWTWLRQVHGADVAVVERPGDAAGARADAAVTTVAGAALAVHTADCVPVVLLGAGVVGVAHAGWRGLTAGVVEATVEAMTAAAPSGGPLRAVVGPCIRSECYEFGPADLDAVADVLGDEVRAVTSSGAARTRSRRRGARGAAAGRGDDVVDDGACTACGPGWFSHRARRDTGRQAAVVWLEASPT